MHRVISNIQSLKMYNWLWEKAQTDYCNPKERLQRKFHCWKANGILSVNSINCSICICLASIKMWITPTTWETTGNLQKGRETPPANKQLK